MSTHAITPGNQRSTQPASINRRLGSTESIYHLLDKLYRLNFVMFAEISGTLDVDQLKLAMQTVQLEQPLLRTRIARDDGQHWFKSVRLSRHRSCLRSARCVIGASRWLPS